MSAISSLKSRVRRKAWAAQKAAESAPHIPQHSNGAEPAEICPHCGKENVVHQPGLCFYCGGSWMSDSPGKLRHC